MFSLLLSFIKNTYDNQLLVFLNKRHNYPSIDQFSKQSSILTLKTEYSWNETCVDTVNTFEEHADWCKSSTVQKVCQHDTNKIQLWNIKMSKLWNAVDTRLPAL